MGKASENPQLLLSVSVQPKREGPPTGGFQKLRAPGYSSRGKGLQQSRTQKPTELPQSEGLDLHTGLWFGRKQGRPSRTGRASRVCQGGFLQFPALSSCAFRQGNCRSREEQQGDRARSINHTPTCHQAPQRKTEQMNGPLACLPTERAGAGL